MKEILENLKQINELEKEREIIIEQIKNEGIEMTNNLLYALNSRLKIYSPILRKLNMGINIQLKQYKVKYNQLPQVVRIAYTYSNDCWQLLYNRIKVELNKGISNLTAYSELCVENPIIQELDFELICKKIEDYIKNVQNDKIEKLEKENNDKQNSLKSFKDFVDNNLMITLNTLFKIKNDFKDTGDLDLIEIIIQTIDNLEAYIAEDLD